MNTQINPYPSKKLPKGFKYPVLYLELISSNKIDIYPWWLIDSKTKAGELFYKVSQLNGKNLIPFAKIDIDDDVACFDGNDNSGNPSIIMNCSTPDRSYCFKDFSQWFEQVQKDIVKYHIDRKA